VSRRWSQTFACHRLDELARQLIRAPEPRRAQQVRRAEKLHDEITPDAAYPYDYLAYRITGYRAPEGTRADLLIGAAVAPDLRLLIDSLSRSIRLTPAPDEQLLPVDDVARELSVSTKTIERWRKAGLRWRWSYDADRGASTVCIERRALERFTLQQPAAIRHATRFDHLDDAQRADVVARARLLTRDEPGLSLHLASQRIAEQGGPSPSTVRRLLLRHDASAAPEQRVFAPRHGPLSDRDRELIYRAMARGVPARRLAARFGKSVSAIRRGAALHRLGLLKQADLSGPQPPVFARDDAEQVYLTSKRARDADRAPTHRPAVSTEGLPQTIAPLYRQAVPGAADQAHLFRRYHYLRYRARTALAQTPQRTPRVADLDAAQRFIDEARDLRSRLIRANLPVVLSVARRHLVQSPGPPHLILPLLEAGHAELFDTFDAFDPFGSRDFVGILTNRLLRRFAALKTTAGGPVRARRRDEDQRIRDRLVEQAQAHGVQLPDPANASGEPS